MHAILRIEVCVHFPVVIVKLRFIIARLKPVLDMLNRNGSIRRGKGRPYKLPTEERILIFLLCLKRFSAAGMDSYVVEFEYYNQDLLGSLSCGIGQRHHARMILR